MSTDRRVGVWLVGGRGSVATTALTGAAAVAAGLTEPTGMVTMRPPFTEAGMPELGDLVFGGHDVVETPLALRAAKLVDDGVLPHGLPNALGAAIEAAESEQRPGITGHEARTEPRPALGRIVSDLSSFKTRHDLQRLVVVNVSSTEAPVEPHPAHQDPALLMDALDRGLGVLPPSALYALAAIEVGAAFVDFTPSVGARLPAIEALAEAHEVPVAGSDGKTGETFMKSVLAPALGTRNLKVRSWAGYNILGGGDGAALADPERAQSKLDSKGKLLEDILGYPVEAPIRIEDVKDMGEWKTAWDHIVFEGFMGVRMKLQFTWEGCDSTLAAPLLLDLIRLMGLALERGERGPMSSLAFFFKDPVGTSEHALHTQYDMLERWVLQRVVA
ncbi:inositol-3-phosphate synthase [Solirubrobacter phytolaccae]|uniref:Inositol-3-phosphate synthase n=1 Tax=Solirubrobacter phytolaccae TaxID=1404360 RepID=A0A9X3NGC8_9ACTN|nr:inositol-3-phosphate synthase [Solirubrobacter phytolaccae]MDA0184582.1 inositol-3-phosphate synthase [Solirubrobacter phytolaccae]